MEDDQDNHLAPSKKRSKKQRTVLAASQLGFEKPQLPVIDFSPRRTRKKPNAGTSEAEQFQRLFNFRSKFRLVVDASEVSQEQAKHFDGTCLNEWLLVQQVIFTAGDNLPIQCPICHNAKEQITAPQITPCGHVFCWPCMLRFLKLSNCRIDVGSGSKCPVCMKHFNLAEMRSCQFYHYPAVVKNAEIRLVLRIKQPHSRTLYDPVTREEDHNFSRLIRVEKEYIKNMLLQEQMELEQYRETERRERQDVIELEKSRLGNTNYKVTSSSGMDVYGDSVELATRALEASIQRLSRVEYQIEQRKDKKKSQFLRDNVHFQVLPQDCVSLQYLYQEEKGRQVFLHPIQNKYLMEEYESNSHLPLSIKSKILFLQPVKQDLKTVHRNNKERIQLYKQLTNLIQTPDGTFIELELRNDLLSKPVARDFLKQMNQYKSDIEERERVESQRNEELVNRRLAIQREKQKKLMEAEPWPVDNEIKDLKNCNRELNFPSLLPNSTVSQIEPKPQLEQLQIKQTQSQPPPKATTVQALEKVIAEQFPQLTELKKQPKDKRQTDAPGNGKKKKKKQQQVDITSLMFQRAEEEWD